MVVGVLHRLVVFFSDTRVPHEVLPTIAPRYAVTTWYMCARERVLAAERKEAAVLKAERQKLEAEEAHFAERR